VRDADYGTMTHYPPTAAIERWLEVYHTVARANGGEPDAGRALGAWARTAGFTDIVATTSTWSYTTAAERRSWSSLWADRILVPHFADRAAELGAADGATLDTIAAGWRDWARHPDGWFAFIHGEVVAANPN
jgi:isopentenyl diphosphate isomerase/L-lactate dehydrogenase-like FMN-dependent dehydrogenase